MENINLENYEKLQKLEIKLQREYEAEEWRRTSRSVMYILKPMVISAIILGLISCLYQAFI